MALGSHQEVEERKDRHGRGLAAVLPPYEGNEVQSTSSPFGNYAPAPGLVRGLQVPSRSPYVTSGFKFPVILARAGITKAEWIHFSDDIRRYADLSSSQWAKTVGASLGTFGLGWIFISWFALIPAGFVGHYMRKDREHLNMCWAHQYGALKDSLDEWNESCFKRRGFVVRVDMPGMTRDVMDMDISTFKMIRHYKPSGHVSTAAGTYKYVSAENQEDPNKTARARRKASRRCRIVIMPLDQQRSQISGSTESKTQVDPIKFA